MRLLTLALLLAGAPTPEPRPPPGGAEAPAPPPPAEGEAFSPQDIPRGPGYVRLTLQAPPQQRLAVEEGGPVRVWEENGASALRTGTLCGPPCRLTLDVRGGTRFRFSGGYHYSDDFSLEGRQGDWVAVVRPDDPGRSNLSIVFLAAGAMALPFGPGLLLLGDTDPRKALPVAAGLTGAAALALGVGLVLWVTNPTTFELHPG